MGLHGDLKQMIYQPYYCFLLLQYVTSMNIYIKENKIILYPILLLIFHPFRFSVGLHGDLKKLTYQPYYCFLLLQYVTSMNIYIKENKVILYPILLLILYSFRFFRGTPRWFEKIDLPTVLLFFVASLRREYEHIH